MKPALAVLVICFLSCAQKSNCFKDNEAFLTLRNQTILQKEKEKGMTNPQKLQAAKALLVEKIVLEEQENYREVISGWITKAQIGKLLKYVRVGNEVTVTYSNDIDPEQDLLILETPDLVMDIIAGPNAAFAFAPGTASGNKKHIFARASIVKSELVETIMRGIYHEYVHVYQHTFHYSAYFQKEAGEAGVVKNFLQNNLKMKREVEASQKTATLFMSIHPECLACAEDVDCDVDIEKQMKNLTQDSGDKEIARNILEYACATKW